MIQLTIDNHVVKVTEGTTLLAAAATLGIEIPTLCYLDGLEPCTSCMVCLVEVAGRSSLLPACATPAADDMVVTTHNDRVRRARKAALELLLSDHLGDCMGPCQVACPAGMDIPLMIRQIAASDVEAAIETVMRDIPLPRTLGRICSAPCEKACRRAQSDQAVSICLLKRWAGDNATSFMPPVRPSTGKTVAIVGSGPAGLAAAYYCQIAGNQCTVFEKQNQAGGRLRTDFDEVTLPIAVLEAEIERIRQLGVTFVLGREVEPTTLRAEYDAVFLATGSNDTKPMVDRSTYHTDQPGVFAGGDLIRNRRLPIRALADGKEAAVAIQQYLSGQPVTGVVKPFNTRMGRLSPEELDLLKAQVSDAPRVEPNDIPRGFDADQARQEAERCLHCDCRKPVTCKLRQYSQEYGAQPSRYKGQRRTLSLDDTHTQVLFEVGKCINCGLCIQIAAQHGESLGLTWAGRGFDLRVMVPWQGPLDQALCQAAEACVQACPTGALAWKDLEHLTEKQP